MATYELLKQEGSAKRAVFHTVHGDIQTPVFMNVGTVAAIKGAVSTMDLKEIKWQVHLTKTDHLQVRQTSDRRLPWHLTSVHRVWQSADMSKILLRVRPAGWSGAKKKCSV